MNDKKNLYYIIHPIIIASYPILFFYRFNQDQLSLSIVIGPLIASCFFAVCVFIISFLIFRALQKTALFTSILVFSFFYYGRFSLLFSNIFIPLKSGFILGPDKILFSLLSLSIFFFGYKIFRSNKSFLNINKFVFVFSMIFLVFELFLISKKEIFFAQQNFNRNIQAESGSDKIDIADRPDIYFIVLDGYARQDILRTVFDFDNSSVLDKLVSLGFKIANNAYSNYAHTPFSLSAILNYKYINDDIDVLPSGQISHASLNSLISSNQTSSFLKELNYIVYNISSGIGSTDNLQSADINFHKASAFTLFGKNLIINEFYTVFLQTTALSPFIKKSLASQARENILYSLNKLTEMPYIRKNKFVVAHINMPHPPYLFDKNGDIIDNQTLEYAGDSFTDRDKYLEYLQFANLQIAPVLEKIIKRSQKPPVIILLSDHGPATYLGNPEKWPRPAANEGIKERMSILYAIYSKKDLNIPDNITSVNTFRRLFNAYFNANLTLLQDKIYFTDNNVPFELFDVTDLLLPKHR